MSTVKIIYIAGTGRSGSTILARILGTLDGVSSFNEITNLLAAAVQNQLCSCGFSFKKCQFWAKVMAEAAVDETNIDRIMDLQEEIDHSRHFIKTWFGLYGKKFRRSLTEYQHWLCKLYLAIANNCGNDIIVDSSKVPTRALLLNRIPGIEVYVIHLVRDVRAVIYSWQKKKFNPGHGRLMRRFPPHRTVLFWIVRNILCEILGSRIPYFRIRYDDFARQPRTALQTLVKKIEPLRGKCLPFEDEFSIYLGPHHSMGGNPNRFSSTLTRIELDLQWTKKLDYDTRRRATLLSYPLLQRYGYTRNTQPL